MFVYENANSDFCHTDIWHYIAKNPDKFPHLKDTEEYDPYKDCHYSMFSHRANQAVHHFVELVKLADLPSDFTQELFYKLKDSPELGEIGDTAVREKVWTDIDAYRAKHGSDHLRIGMYGTSNGGDRKQDYMPRSRNIKRQRSV